MTGTLDADRLLDGDVNVAEEFGFPDPDTVALRPDDDVVLQVRGLSVSFGGIRAVSAVNFDLVRGEILGVVGPNGAGKTTMFDAISGFVTSAGNVRLDGRDVGSMNPEARSRARLGRSFQDARLFPSLTVFESLSLALERHLKAQDPVSTALKLPWVRKAEKETAAQAEALIERMGLTAFRDKFISELSTGSRRIVDLASIIAHDPLVLLLDEPSSGIAQREAEALGPLLLRLREDTGLSIIIIEHDMPLLTSVSDRLLALELGQVLTSGDTDVVMNDPRLVAAYLGGDDAVVKRSGVDDTTVAPVAKGSSNGSGEKASVPAAPPAATRTPVKKRRRSAVGAARKPVAAGKRTAKKSSARKKRSAPLTARPAKKTTKKSAATKSTTKKRSTKKRAAPAKKQAVKKKAAAVKRPLIKKVSSAKRIAPKKVSKRRPS